jgi:transposase
MSPDAPQRDDPLREVFNALRYMARGGESWRMLPHDFPPWQVVYQQTRRWFNAGVFETMVHDLRAILRLVRTARPSMLVDVGCGEGIVLRHLSEQRAVDGHMYGFDIDSTGLGVAQSQNTVRLIQGSIVSLPFADRSIDMVLCCEVLEHVEQPELGAAAAARSGPPVRGGQHQRHDEDHTQRSGAGDVRVGRVARRRAADLRHAWPRNR